MALPVIKYLYGSPVFDPNEYFSEALNGGTFQPATQTSLVLQDADSARIVFKGTFTVDGMGVVTGGTVTGFDTFVGNAKLQTASGFDISATALIAGVEQWQMFNDQPLNDLLFELPTRFVGSEQGDRIDAEGAGSVVVGRQGDDRLFAEMGDTSLKGGKDNDVLIAWQGLCRYSGGEGQDVFGFMDPALPNRVKDFAPDDDYFLLNSSEFVGVDPGFLEGAQFKIGKQASTPEQIIVYQRSKGNVWYDQDGSESVFAPVRFAKVDKGLDLGAGNFYAEDYGIMV